MLVDHKIKTTLPILFFLFYKYNSIIISTTSISLKRKLLNDIKIYRNKKAV